MKQVNALKTMVTFLGEIHAAKADVMVNTITIEILYKNAIKLEHNSNIHKKTSNEERTLNWNRIRENRQMNERTNFHISNFHYYI